MQVNFLRKSRSKARPNLTPLIDVIFLLIVFFLLTSKFIVVESINLGLTSTEAGDVVAPSQESIVIALLPDGKFICKSMKGDIEELGVYLAQTFKDLSSRDIVLRFNKAVKVQDVVSAMDIIKLSGGTKISLADDGEA